MHTANAYFCYVLCPVSATCRNCGGPVKRHRPYRLYVSAVCNERTLDPLLTHEDPSEFIVDIFKLLGALVLIGTALHMLKHGFYLF